MKGNGLQSNPPGRERWTYKPATSWCTWCGLKGRSFEVSSSSEHA
jgi:hypothetical protein